MTKKYSSFKLQQTITENFRRFINETLSEEETAPGLMHIAPDQRAFWIFDMWIPESVEEMYKILYGGKASDGGRYDSTWDSKRIRKDFVNWAHRKVYDEARDNMKRDWEGDEDDDDAWLDYVEEFESKLEIRKEELLNSDELLGKIKKILKWDEDHWVRAGLSFAPDYQTITENFRRFINEDDRYEREYDQAAARGAGAIPAEAKAIIDFIRNEESGTLENSSGEVIVDITKLSDEVAWQVLAAEGIFDAVAADFKQAGVKNPDVGDISTAIQNWINDRGLTPDGEIDYGRL